MCTESVAFVQSFERRALQAKRLDEALQFKKQQCMYALHIVQCTSQTATLERQIETTRNSESDGQAIFTVSRLPVAERRKRSR